MSKKRLLVVDDEPEIAEIVRQVASKAGYDVRVTTRAREFPRAYEEFDPSVILLDIVMPETDGIELMNWLAKQTVTARLIVASGYSPEYAKMAATIGTAQGLAVSYLDKPFQLGALRAALRDAEEGG